MKYKKYYVFTLDYAGETSALGPITKDKVDKEVEKAKSLYNSYVVVEDSAIQYPILLREDLSKLITAFTAKPNYKNCRDIFKFLRTLSGFLIVSSSYGALRKQKALQCKKKNKNRVDDCRGCSYSVVGPQITQSFEPVLFGLGRSHDFISWYHRFNQQGYEDKKGAQKSILYCPIVALIRIAKLIDLTKVSGARLGMLVPPMLMMLSVLSNPPFCLNETKKNSEKK